MLTALQNLQDAYTAGLIDQEAITNTTSSCRDEWYAGTVGCFPYWGGLWGQTLTERLQQNDKNVELSQAVTDSLAVVSANAKNISVFPVSEQRTMITSDLTTTRENIISRVAMGQLTPEEGMAEYKAQAETLNVAQALEEMNANA